MIHDVNTITTVQAKLFNPLAYVCQLASDKKIFLVPGVVYQVLLLLFWNDVAPTASTVSRGIFEIIKLKLKAQCHEINRDLCSIC